MDLKPCKKCGNQPQYHSMMNYYVCEYCTNLEKRNRMDRAAVYWNEDNHVE